jgi:hypothetical protein
MRGVRTFALALALGVGAITVAQAQVLPGEERCVSCAMIEIPGYGWMGVCIPSREGYQECLEIGNECVLYLTCTYEGLDSDGSSVSSGDCGHDGRLGLAFALASTSEANRMDDSLEGYADDFFSDLTSDR